MNKTYKVKLYLMIFSSFKLNEKCYYNHLHVKNH